LPIVVTVALPSRASTMHEQGRRMVVRAGGGPEPCAIAARAGESSAAAGEPSAEVGEPSAGVAATAG
jgi:hypothetical protein